MTWCAALVLAGGSGNRFGGSVPKQYRALRGQSVLRHSIAAFAAHPGIDTVQAVIRAEDRTLYEEAAAGLDLLPPVEGGATRQESARLGLESLAELSSGSPSRVLIHDAARPVIDAALIARVIAAIDSHPAAIPAISVGDTLKRGEDGVIAATIDRAQLWRAQTPQAFRMDDILAAHRASSGAELSDDAAVAERAGLTVALVAGKEDNIKITSEADLRLAERLMGGSAGEVRVGAGFDVHAFGPGNSVMLGGVAIPHENGLIGHSDGDAALHALTDAILGAIAAGDIGVHFPPDDPKWRDAASETFLRHAGTLVAERGGEILHLDLTVICERPKIGPHRAVMAARIADILELELGRVSIKATTTEGLGFTGRAEGIAAQATATLRLPPNVMKP